MIRHLMGCVLLTAVLAGPALAEQGKPKLAKETRDAAQITQENIVKMKLRRVTPNPNQNLMPVLQPPPNPGN
jgi:hypothetical protein